MNKLTVLTPTYNRAELIKNCYISLKNQTNKDFEWLIIDDGSVDDTEEVVRSFIDCENDFSIKYHKKQNGGKHTALNYSHDYIDGRYLIILDSDDVLTEDAVETVIREWERFDSDENIWCLCFLKGYDRNKSVCEWKGKDVIVSDYIRFSVKYLPGDCAEVVRSDVFKKYKFPEFEGERFLGEGYLWINAAYEYKTVYIKKILYLCAYLDDGLSKSGRKLRLKNPQGGMCTADLYFGKGFSIKNKIKHAILFDVYAFSAGNVLNNIKKARKKFLCYLCLPLGWFFYKKWKK